MLSGAWVKLRKLLGNRVARVNMSAIGIRQTSGLWTLVQCLFGT